nr:type IV secretory system conjugative DNA transfer family protein [Adlercreutzia sp. ZJ141]
MSGEAAAVCAGVLGICAVWIVAARMLLGAGTRRDGEEHGSSRWATKREARAFADRSHPDNNILLTKDCALALSRDKFNLKTDRNKNVLVVGGSGSGKTRYYVKPNLMQMNASFFVTDPKGTLLGDVGHMLKTGGYRIITFDTINFERSCHYNPLAYIESEADILTFVDCLIKNTSPEGGKPSDPFWENAERLLYSSLVAYLLNHCPKADQNIPGLLTLLSLAEAKEEDESFMSPLDILFKELETGMRLSKEGEALEIDPESRKFGGEAFGYSWVKQQEPVKESEDFALSNYKAFKTAAGKTLKSIIISCNVRLKPLSIREVSELLSYDEMGLDHLGDPGRKTALFASMSDTNSTFDCLFAILMWQTLNILCDTALERFGGKLPTPVHMMFDEFANIGTVPDFAKMIAVIRSRNISCSIILQSFSQLKSHYDDDAQTITDCCDTMLFLGGKSSDTNKEISEAIGKQTLATMSINDSRGSSSSTTKNYNKQERDLLQASEVGRLARDEAIVLIAGAFPIRDKKYPLEKHPRYALVDPGHKGARYDSPFKLKNTCGNERKEATMT